MWIWDALSRSLGNRTFTAADASFLAAAVVAEQLHRIDPDNHDLRKCIWPPDWRLPNGSTDTTAHSRMRWERSIDDADGGRSGFAGSGASTGDRKRRCRVRPSPRSICWARRKSDELLRSSDGKPRLLAKSLISPMRARQICGSAGGDEHRPDTALSGQQLPARSTGLFIGQWWQASRVGRPSPRRKRPSNLAGFFNVLGFAADSQPVGREAGAASVYES